MFWHRNGSAGHIYPGRFEIAYHHIIKERFGASDEETVEQILENPYLQYFLGFEECREEAPFHPTIFVHFRKRMGIDAWLPS